jgi:Ser/Thr protein kinase RdoA (MazF antagonist)
VGGGAPPAAGPPPRLAVEQLPSWWCNTVLKLDADGERLVLRRYGLTPPEEVRWEIALLLHLGTHAFPTVTPLPRAHPGGTDPTGAYLSDFLGYPAILYPFIEGQSARDGQVEWRHAIAETAAVVARLAALTAGLVLPYPRVQSGTDSRRVLRELREYAAQRDVSTPEPALDDLLSRAEQMDQHLTARIAPYADRPNDLPRGIVHHDAHWANVLFHENRFVALIDFDDACEGYLVSDLAAMVANWGVPASGEALDPVLASLAVREYERHRPLTAVERDLLPDFVAAFILADGAAYVRDRLTHSANGDVAVRECNAFRRLQHRAGDPDRMRELRLMLTRREP